MNFEIGQVFESIYPPQAAEWCNNNNAHFEIINDKYTIVANPVYEPTYIDNRLAEYPAINDQLDMIYHDQINQTSVWLNTITAIKQKYPKNIGNK